MLLHAKVLKMNSKSLEVGGAEEHRLLRGGEYRLLRGALCGCMFTARLFFSDGAGHRAKA